MQAFNLVGHELRNFRHPSSIPTSSAAGPCQFIKTEDTLKTPSTFCQPFLQIIFEKKGWLEPQGKVFYGGLVNTPSQGNLTSCLIDT
jgi:hypothetical protein